MLVPISLCPLLQASCYLNKLPPRFSPDDRVLVSDVILATGGTLVQVVDELVARGARTENMRVIRWVC